MGVFCFEVSNLCVAFFQHRGKQSLTEISRENRRENRGV